MSKLGVALSLAKSVLSALPPGVLQGPVLAGAIAAATACVALAAAFAAPPEPALTH